MEIATSNMCSRGVGCMTFLLSDGWCLVLVQVKVFKLSPGLRDASAAFASLREFEHSRSGPLPLYISPESPGLQLLVRVMISTPKQLGYSEHASIPNNPDGTPLALGDYHVTNLVLERRGTAHNGGSWVFFGEAHRGQEQGERAVLKLNVQDTEVNGPPSWEAHAEQGGQHNMSFVVCWLQYCAACVKWQCQPGMVRVQTPS